MIERLEEDLKILEDELQFQSVWQPIVESAIEVTEKLEGQQKRLEEAINHHAVQALNYFNEIRQNSESSA